MMHPFYEQVGEIIQACKKQKVTRHSAPVSSMLIHDPGRACMSGFVVQHLFRQVLKIPVMLSDAPGVPGFVNAGTLVIVYGRSEQDAAQPYIEEAERRQAAVCMVLCDAGANHLFQQESCDTILAYGKKNPEGSLMTEVAALILLLCKYKLLPSQVSKELAALPDWLRHEEDNIQMVASYLAEKFQGKIPVIYTTTQGEAIAACFSHRLNRKARMACWHHVIPEMNHNELVGWAEEYPELAVLFISYKEEYYRNMLRMDATKKQLRHYTEELLQVYAKGPDDMAMTFYLLQLCEQVCAILAEQRDALSPGILQAYARA